MGSGWVIEERVIISVRVRYRGHGVRDGDSRGVIKASVRGGQMSPTSSPVQCREVLDLSRLGRDAYTCTDRDEYVVL